MDRTALLDPPAPRVRAAGALPLPAWSADFRAPPAVDRPQPLWSWNGEIDEARIDEQVAQFAAQGCGGVFIHPRPGLVTEYLSPRWFALWRHAYARCREHGIECHIYDENSFPSGFAGGHVVADAPQTAARFIRRTRCSGDTVLPADEELLACVDALSGAPLADDAWRTATADAPVLALTHARLPADPWHAGFPLPDISLAATGAAFIASTHAAYARETGAGFGRGTRMVFTDEPTLPRPADGVLWSDELAGTFADDHGYRLEDRLGQLFADGPGHQAVRHDYHATLNRMVLANFFRPVHDWCAAKGLAATGHLDEHMWPAPGFLPSAAAALRWMQVPGNDLLAFQFTASDRLHERNRMARLNLRELDSVARQAGRARTLAETGGGGGYACGPALFKRLEDFAMAMGITVVDPHLAHATLVGARKYDWPQSLSDHSPWWADYRAHADHVGRVVTALRRGAVVRRVLVLMPTTSAWLHARPALERGNPLEAIRERTFALIDALEDAGIDYDLGDETVLAELARVDAGDRRLVVGGCAYQAVVVPATMANWERTTLALLRAAQAAGIPIHGEGPGTPTHVAGRPDARPAALAADWRRHADAEALAAALRLAFPPQLTAADGGPLPPELVWRRVELPEGSVVFATNPWDRPLATTLRLPGRGLLACDTASGGFSAEDTDEDGDGQAIALTLAPGEHRLWLCTTTPVAPPATPAWQDVPATAAGITADHPNALVLDVAELEVPDTPLLRSSTTRVDTALWRAMGFTKPVWQTSIQYRRRFLEREDPTRPGFRVTYVARIDADATCDDVRLAVEQPWLYRVTVNDRAVDGWQRWFDPQMAAAAIGHLLRPGANRIILAADHFSVRHELAPVFLLGGFALREDGEGFTVGAARPLALGTWRELGRPLACGAMDYAWRFTLDAPAAALRVTLPRWTGATWRATIDGRLLAIAAGGQDRVEADCALAAGAHRLTVRIAGHPAGLLGPHHVEGLPGRWTWERPWDPAPAIASPGAAWRAPAAGLLAPPEIAATAAGYR